MKITNENVTIMKQPVSQFELTRTLPSIEELEAELSGIHQEESGDE